ncbi:hypothetical protein B0A54_14134 [Friedmanniomyces endolithicus]|uniref:F-box domain-containing protein n=1 Tax=Friedmanniomyces endolithicus TaxID=329885 RepID=A0A4U0UDU5_9PEZI|nr:hypothetical protein LTS09_012679 [Friedmanniomyces endolithicus]KAK0311808.1 hypothetical protein LTR01_002722 [Friedmanniomyces endolithicus]KAK0832041.1 hypothetical protein LTR73_002328 [Friedmanniomyces endolithicus]TKA33437.1 hypothetical protein B0A54_14134 [Friedmanniomyces endolithicus]
MDRLPEEVILHILGFLNVPDIVHLQAVSSRYLALGRDNALWKTECFEDSRAESLRRRDMLLGMQDARIAELRNAVTALPGPDLTAWDVSQLRGSSQPRASNDPAAEARIQRARALANWEPGYPDERLDYYDEYVHRHAPVKVAWLDLPKAQASDKEEYREATGCATLDYDDGNVNHLVAPLDDGSICIWDVSDRSTSMPGGRGRLTAQSRPGLLTGMPPEDTSQSHIMMTETGAVECVSIDNTTKRGYFAVQRSLHEVDINALQLVSTKHYPWPITALSEAKTTTPLTIGTNWTVHLHDPRDSALTSPHPNNATTTSLLNPSSTSSHATLAQPGPLSILHDPSTSPSIWLAGRFTSLLHYDRRAFPRLLSTLHSGARIASLASLPYPLIPQSLDLIRNPDTNLSALVAARSAPGTTILAAAEYKGKGSLELYGLPRVQPYQNRQTASASKLLAVAPHGGRIVFSDGDGNVKWVERDGFSHVRTFNINEALPLGGGGGGGWAGAGGKDAGVHGIWGSTADGMPGQGDIVQKITPMHPVSASGTGSTSGMGAGQQRQDVNQSNLLLWTGDGRLGVLGFGPGNPLGEDQWREEVGVAAESTEQRAKGDAERQYGMAMRRALERNADEVRFVRGLGMLM